MPKDRPLEELVEEDNERARRRRVQLRTAGEGVAAALAEVLLEHGRPPQALEKRKPPRALGL
jgi:hypothetical protein